MARRIAVIGSGYWGRNLVRNFHQLGALHSVCDGNPQVETEIREKYPQAVFRRNYAEVLADADVDAVVVATPAVTHFEMARQAMEAGKDVYVEKPLALNVNEGADLERMADRCGRIVMVGHILQYHPAVLKLKELIVGGGLGRIHYIYSNRLNMGKIRTEENILWSFAPHDISVVLSMLDEDPTERDLRWRRVFESRRGGCDAEPAYLFERGSRAHLRELAASLQGAAPGGGGIGEDGGIR